MTAASSPVRPALLSARWRHVALLSWPVADAPLQPLLPESLELDRWDGNAYVSLVGLWFEDVRVLGVPSPVRRYPEVNLRFYARRPGQRDAGQPGVVFIRQMVPHRITAMAARWLYGEPFVTLPLSCRICHETGEAPNRKRRVSYAWRDAGREQRFWAESDGEPGRAASGSLEEFLTARYWGYNGRPGRPTRAYRLTRPAWTISPASAWGLDCDVASLLGLRDEFAETMSGPPASALLSSGSPARVHWPRRLTDD